MNKMMKIVSIILLSIIVFDMLSLVVIAENCVSENGIEHEQISNEVEWIPMEATAYCIQGKTASGKMTRPGVCATSREHLGQTACVYLRNSDDSVGEFIGYFDCLDCGGKAISSGKVIDLWYASRSDALKFGRKKVFVVFVNAEG